jgi:hypothetical protein
MDSSPEELDVDGNLAGNKHSKLIPIYPKVSFGELSILTILGKLRSKYHFLRPFIVDECFSGAATQGHTVT